MSLSFPPPCPIHEIPDSPAAEWVILITPLEPEAFATADGLALYRYCLRIEILFAHLKRHRKLTRLRRCGLAGASEEFRLAATAQNRRKLVKLTARSTPSTA